MRGHVTMVTIARYRKVCTVSILLKMCPPQVFVIPLCSGLGRMWYVASASLRRLLHVFIPLSACFTWKVRAAYTILL